MTIGVFFSIFLQIFVYFCPSLALASQINTLFMNGSGASAMIGSTDYRNYFSNDASSNFGVISGHFGPNTMLSLGLEKFSPITKDTRLVRVDQKLFGAIKLSLEYHHENWFYLESSRKAKIAMITGTWVRSKGNYTEFGFGSYERYLVQTAEKNPYDYFRYNTSDQEGWYLFNLSTHWVHGIFQEAFEFGNWSDFYLGTSDLWRLDYILSWAPGNGGSGQLNFLIGIDMSGLSGLTTQPTNLHLSATWLIF